MNKDIACALPLKIGYMQINNGILTNELVCLVLFCFAFRLKDTTIVNEYFNFCRAKKKNPPKKQTNRRDISLCECNFGLGVTAGRVPLSSHKIYHYTVTPSSLCQSVCNL